MGSCIYRLIGYIWGLFEIYGKKLLFAKDVIHKEKTKIYIISKIHDFISILIKTWKKDRGPSREWVVVSFPLPSNTCYPLLGNRNVTKRSTSAR